MPTTTPEAAGDVVEQVVSHLRADEFDPAATAILAASSSDRARIVSNPEAMLLIEWAGAAMPRRHEVLDQLAESASTLADLGSLFKLRYGVTVGSAGDSGAAAWAKSRDDGNGREIPFEPKGVKALYEAFSRIPSSQLGSVTHAMRIAATPGKSRGATGTSGEAGESYFIVRYDDANLELTDEGAFSDKDDRLFGTAVFSKVALHEFAHLIDEGDKYSGQSSFRGITGWTYFGNAEAPRLVEELRTEFDDLFVEALPDKELEIAIAAFAILANREIDHPDDVGSAVYSAMDKLGLDWYKGDSNGAYRTSEEIARDLLGSSSIVVHFLRTYPSETNTPWYDEPYADLPRRQYHQSQGAHGWWSYPNEARKDSISNYQFKSPGEEFSEVYAAYFLSPTPGSLLPPKFKEWFEAQGLAD